ncbi:hypothetical protein [Glycomyces harbinensis]|uniref:tRNA nuclease CdiA C-terminal domain-containing protein n=1 Tax=Glycomyces harbinensis TaxID=58114 RepID=A0A1G6RGI1_9ACTN|nr:hypothetical protein [Glycomyces harbinensis]SDD03551.1 hypothetical protein SAMN05216270_101473 [Glycomyces harbinensis]
MSTLSELITRLRALVEHVHEARSQVRHAQDRTRNALHLASDATQDSSSALIEIGRSQWRQAVEKLTETDALLAGGNRAWEQYIAGTLLGGTAGIGLPRSGSGADANARPLTRPSLPPDPARKPAGAPTKVERGSSGITQAGIKGENDAAIVLAHSGYRVRQNPPPKPDGRRPDYAIEGDYWDCYTVLPSTGNVERVRKSIKSKVDPKNGRPQTGRIILNLDAVAAGRRTPIGPGEVERLLRRKPVSGLEELKIIRDDRVHDVDLGG